MLFIFDFMYLKLCYFVLFSFLAEAMLKIDHLRDKGVYIDINQPQEGSLGYIRNTVHIGRGAIYCRKKFRKEKK